MKRKMGCLRDKLDERDFLMRSYLPLVKLPVKLDYTVKMSPVRDQGDEGTCVGFASSVGMKEYQEQKDYEKLVVLSPRYLYSECKKIDGMPESEGTSIRMAMKVLFDKGVCRENFWPYVPKQINKAKSGAVADAKKFKVKSFARILNLHELRTSLAVNGPCVIGVQVYEGMMDAKNGVVPMPGKEEYSVGGHAICHVGYEDGKKRIKFKNSWSEKWGDNGYGYLPYTYIEKFMMDAWSSVDIEDPNPLTLGEIMKYARTAKR